MLFSNYNEHYLLILFYKYDIFIKTTLFFYKRKINVTQYISGSLLIVVLKIMLI